MSNLPEEPKAAPEPGEVVSKRQNNPLLGRRGFEFDLNSAIRFATGLVESGMAPKGMKAGAVVAILEAGKELGLAPMFALGNLTLVNGRLGIMGDAAKALIRAAGVLEPGTDFDEIYSGEELTDDRMCTVTAHRAGQAKPFTRSFSIRDAHIAGLCRVWQYPKVVSDKATEHLAGQRRYQSRETGGWGVSGPWATYTDRMLMYRALGFLCRDYFSDILAGAVIQEEFNDYPASAKGGQNFSKDELVSRFMPDTATKAESVDVVATEAAAEIFAPAETFVEQPGDCPHDVDPPTFTQNVSGVPTECCAKCGVPWASIEGGK